MHPALAMVLGIVIGWQLCLLAREIAAAIRNRRRPVVDVKIIGVDRGTIGWNELRVVRR